MRIARARLSCLLITLALVVTTPVSARAQTPSWTEDLDALIGGRPFSVVVGADGQVWYRNRPAVRRPPASNQKLLLSMVLLDLFGADRTIRTELRTTAGVVDGVVTGDLWMIGRGDPEVGHDDLTVLADGLVERGVRRVAGDVIGSTRPFQRDWWAPGWKDYFPDVYAPLPTALTFEGNEAGGRHITDPERRAASVLLAKLEARGISVRGHAEMGVPPTGMRTLVTSASDPFDQLLRAMNVSSRNFHAEVLGKYLGAQTSGVGSIAAGASRVCAWIAARGESFECHDGSGLSYSNRATAIGFVRLLWEAEDEPWGTELRMSLPSGGQGTLKGRLTSVHVRAKTGTLTDVSALSGWVFIESAQEWVPFSILSSGYDDGAAKGVEDAIVRLIANEAIPPG